MLVMDREANNSAFHLIKLVCHILANLNRIIFSSNA